MAEAGTLQRALGFLAEILRPAQAATEAGSAAELLSGLGVTASPAQASGLANAIRPLAAAASGLAEEVEALIAALEADNSGEAASRTIAALDSVRAAFDVLAALPTAVSGLGLPAALQANFAGRLFDHLFARALIDETGTGEVLALLGILRQQPVNADLSDPQVPPHVISSFDFSRIGDWFEDPVGALASEYGWGTGGFDAAELLTRLTRLLLRYGPPSFVDEDPSTPTIEAGLFELRPAPPGLALELRQSVSAQAISFADDDFSVTLDPDIELPFGLTLTLAPPFSVSASVQGGGLPSGEVRAEIAVDRTGAAEPVVLFGEADASRLTFRRLSLGGSVRFTGSEVIPGLRLEIADGEIVIGTEEADGFIAKILDGVRLETEFDIGAGITADQGVFFEGSATLEVQLPLHLSLGPVDIDAFTVALGIDGSRFPLSLGANVKAELGPLVAVVENMGLTANFELTSDRDGNAGPLDIDVVFKPPTGVGLSIDAGAVKGGGFLKIDVPRGEYAGLLQLSILEIVTVTAIGIINTKMPDGSEGFSFLAIISVEFNPGIQLGFGFTLLGVGGLVGLNRSMDLDALVAGARSGSIDTILFPKDVVANATKIISDIRDFFPPEEGTFLIGPMTKFGWGTPTLISLSLGIIIEVPGNIAIVGKLTVAIPDERVPLIIIQVAFMGAIEFDRKRGWFFAVLFDSRVLYLTLEGGIGVLADFGSEKAFILSVGGFHPSYNPPDLPFPDIPRIAINLLNTPVAKVIVTCYFAVTSNTVQFGAAVRVEFSIKIASIEGHIGFNALFQFSPFYFNITINAELSVKIFGAGLFSIGFDGLFEGPTPWHIKGRGSIKIVFWRVKVPFEETWGDKEDTNLPPISVVPILAAEFEKVENWTARLENSSALRVSLRTLDPATELVLHPVGALAITQRAVPLAVTLDKIGNQRPDDANRFSIDAATIGIEKRGTLHEDFATAQFRDLSDDQKLGASDFESEEAGLELSVTGNQSKTSFMTKRVARYEQIIIDSNFLRMVIGFATLIQGLFTHFLGANAVARSVISVRTRDRKHLFDEKISVKPNSYVVANVADNSPLAASNVTFLSRASAESYLAEQTKSDPGLAERAHILRAHEVKEAA